MLQLGGLLQLLKWDLLYGCQRAEKQQGLKKEKQAKQTCQLTHTHMYTLSHMGGMCGMEILVKEWRPVLE